MVRWVRFGVLVLAIWAHASARAQIVGALDVSGGAARVAGFWARESRVAPLLRYSSAFGFAQARGLAIERGGSLSLNRASFAAAAASPAFAAGLLRLSVSGEAASDSAIQERWNDARAQVALSARLRSNGVFAGGAVEGGAPSLVVGAWRAFGAALFSVTSRSAFGSSSTLRVNTFQEQYWDSVFTDTGGWHQYHVTRTVTDTSTVARLVQSRVVEASLDWGVGPWTLRADVFRHTATDSIPARTLARATATLRVRSGLSLFATGGSTAGPFSRAAPARFGSIGVRVSPSAWFDAPARAEIRPAATAFIVTPAPDGRYRLVLRVPSARSVEVSGDFTHWTPVAMHETAANLWEVTLPLAPGTYRVNVRVNGDAWTAPPGVPAVDDEFNGRVGIVVVR